MIDAMNILHASGIILFILPTMIFTRQGLNTDPHCDYVGKRDTCCNNYGNYYVLRNSSLNCHGFKKLANKLLVQYSSSLASDSYSIVFINSSLHKIPALAFHMFSDLREVYLNHTNVNTMDMGAFVGLTKLEKLYLSNNNISNIDVGTLNHLLSLKTLVLSNNNIYNFSEDIFKNLANLKILQLNDNKLQTLGEGIFSSLSNAIEINLSQNNFNTFNFSLFHELTELRLLNLSNNQIQSLPRSLFKDLSKLDVLDLSRNLLTSIPLGLLSGLKQLKYLNVSYNHLTIIDSKSLYSLQYLVELNIAGNSLSNLDAEELTSLFKNLKLLHLEENKWSCSTVFAILKVLRMANVLVESGNSYRSDNIHGIGCNHLPISHSESSVAASIKNLSTNLTSTINEDQIQDHYQHLSNILEEISEKISNNNDFLKKIVDVVQVNNDQKKLNVEKHNISELLIQNVSDTIKNINKILINFMKELKTTNYDDVMMELKNELVSAKGLLEEISKSSERLVHFQESINMERPKVNNEIATKTFYIDHSNTSTFMDNVNSFIRNTTDDTEMLHTKIKQLSSFKTDNQLMSELLQTEQTTTSIGNEKTSSLVICLSVLIVILFIILGIICFRNTKYKYTLDSIGRFRHRLKQNKSNVDLVDNSESALNSQI